MSKAETLTKQHALVGKFQYIQCDINKSLAKMKGLAHGKLLRFHTKNKIKNKQTVVFTMMN